MNLIWMSTVDSGEPISNSVHYHTGLHRLDSLEKIQRRGPRLFHVIFLKSSCDLLYHMPVTEGGYYRSPHHLEVFFVGNAGDSVLEVSPGILVVQVSNCLDGGVPGNVPLNLVLKPHSLYLSLSLQRERDRV